ncbi:hypothetical protein Tco_0421974, partial [Tanacetum coccineum]
KLGFAKLSLLSCEVGVDGSNRGESLARWQNKPLNVLYIIEALVLLVVKGLEFWQNQSSKVVCDIAKSILVGLTAVKVG